MLDSGFTEEDNDNDDDEYDDDTKILKSRRSGFSRAKLEAGRNELQLDMSLKVVVSVF